jgi:flagellar motor switch protein FliM
MTEAEQQQDPETSGDTRDPARGETPTDTAGIPSAEQPVEPPADASPGDARDPARSEVRLDAAGTLSTEPTADAPSAERSPEPTTDAPSAERSPEPTTDAPSAERSPEPTTDLSDPDQPDNPRAQEPAGGTGGDRDARTDQLAPAESDDPPASRRRERGGHQIRTVDFSQPTKFTAELRRRIARVLGSFCEAFALRLSSELRAPVELAVADSSQLTWAAAKAQLSANTIAVALKVQPIERQMLLCVEPPLVLQALECLLGGNPSRAASERRFSEVDWALTQRLLKSMIAQLGPAWRDLGGLELSLGEVDLEGDAGVVAPIGEPTFVLTLESRIDALPSSMSLLIPWSAIGPVAEEILGSGPRVQDTDSREARAMRLGLAGAHVCLRAEVGAREMPVERVLALTPGTLLALQDRAEEGVRLFAEGVPLGRGRPGLRGARRAVKLTETIAPGANTAQPLHSNTPTTAAGRGQATPTRESLARMMGVPVRVWAELGRTMLPLGQALELPTGAVVELDQGAESPIELFVNGMRFAYGALLLGAEGEWAVQIDALA